MPTNVVEFQVVSQSLRDPERFLRLVEGRTGKKDKR